MFRTSFGAFDGNSWEALCQQVFKSRFATEGYQQIPASPGDFGLEGFTMSTGIGFQCYCPDKHYTRDELYEAQRDKITRDLGKLKKYESEIKKRLGSTKLKDWFFVTPELDKNSLLSHARAKEEEVRNWKLEILDPEFRVHLQDADHYLVEINEIRSAAGEALDFSLHPPELPSLTEPREVYEENVLRKSKSRLEPKRSSDKYDYLVSLLSKQTLDSFLEANAFFKNIEDSAPMLYFRLVRLINEYENYVVETRVGWTGTADELTAAVRDGLTARISRELAPQFNETSASQVSRHMVARWLAICQIDYD